MALGFYFSPAAMSAAQYDDCLKRLRKAGAEHPRGRAYHVCLGGPDKVAVFDVWTSQAEFDTFGQTLMPILQQIGVDPGQPQVMPVHNVVVPPAPKARPAARKAAPKKRAAPRKAAARGRKKR